LEYTGYAVFCISLFISHIVQGITGFGAVILALPVIVFFFPVTTVVPALIVVNLLQTTYFMISQREHIDWKQVRSIVLFMLVGVPFGYAVFSEFSPDALKTALGIFVIFVAVWNLSGVKLEKPAPMALYKLLLMMGGVAQGALASGGPFIAIYSARMVPEKAAFRATLSTVWTGLNIVLCVAYTATGAWNSNMPVLMGLAVPCLVLGTATGMALHDRIREEPFKKLVYVVLLIAGAVLLKPVISGLL